MMKMMMKMMEEQRRTSFISLMQGGSSALETNIHFFYSLALALAAKKRKELKRETLIWTSAQASSKGLCMYVHTVHVHVHIWAVGSCWYVFLFFSKLFNFLKKILSRGGFLVWFTTCFFLFFILFIIYTSVYCSHSQGGFFFPPLLPHPFHPADGRATSYLGSEVFFFWGGSIVCTMHILPFRRQISYNTTAN